MQQQHRRPRAGHRGHQGVHALQQVKGRVHRRLLERLNLSNLDRLDREQVVEAIRKVVHDLITQEMRCRSTSRSGSCWWCRCWTRSSAWARSSR